MAEQQAGDQASKKSDHRAAEDSVIRQPVSAGVDQSVPGCVVRDRHDCASQSVRCAAGRIFPAGCWGRLRQRLPRAWYRPDGPAWSSRFQYSTNVFRIQVWW